MATNDEDYHAFFGLAPDEKDIPRVEYEFNTMVAEEINAMRLLHPQIAMAFELCKEFGVSQQWNLNSVQTGRGSLATCVSSDGFEHVRCPHR